jgi:hypothetical protein
MLIPRFKLPCVIYLIDIENILLENSTFTTKSFLLVARKEKLKKSTLNMILFFCIICYFEGGSLMISRCPLQKVFKP